MLVVMHSHATAEQVRVVCERIESLGLKAHPIPGAARTAIGITGNDGAIDLGILESVPGVAECIPVSKPYKLVSRDAKEEDSVIRIPTPSGEVLVGGVHLALVAGPCAVESEAQCMAIAGLLKPTGVRLFRGGAYKPRTSPYSFQGLGEPGLKILAKIRDEFGFGIITEAIDLESLDLVEKYAEVIQIGARNMQNLNHVGIFFHQVQRFVVDGFGNDAKAKFVANFRKNLQSGFAKPLNTVRRRPWLVSATAKKSDSSGLEPRRNRHTLRFRFHRAWTCHQCQVHAANQDVTQWRGNSNDGIFFLGVATHQLVRLADWNALGHPG